MPYYPVSKPFIGIKEKKYVNEALKSKAISGFFGKNIIKFEKKFAQFCRTKYAFTCSSGTTALHLAILMLNLKKNDEVLIPAITNMATYFSALYERCKVVPVDVLEDDLNIDPYDLKKKISNKSKALIVVHLFGKPVEFNQIFNILKNKNIKIIEDCAEAHGASYGGKKVGSIGDIGCFSFYANKIITTGEGGMVITNNKKFYDKGKSLKQLSFGKKNKFIHEDIGYNYRLTNLQASIGLAQIENINKIISERDKIKKNYNFFLSKRNYYILPLENHKDITTVCWQYHIILKKKSKKIRDIIIKELKNHNIEAREGFISATLQTQLNKNNFLKKNKCIKAERNSYSSFYLPTYLGLKLSDQKYISEILIKICDKYLIE